MSRQRLDCVLIGYNEPDFRKATAAAREAQQYSPVYSELQRSSVNYGGHRLPYMELLNAGIRDATGHDPGLNVGHLPNLGIAYLASFLKRSGLEVDYVNFYRGELAKLESLLATEPTAVAITTTFYVSSDPITEICETVRRLSPSTRIIVGGPHVYNICSSLDAGAASLMLQMMGGDIFVFDSQGEATLATVLHELSSGRPTLQNVPNLFYLDPAGTMQTTARQIEDNDMDGNVVQWDLFPGEFYRPTAQMRTARSCAFDCAFCRFPAVGGPLTLNSLEVIEQSLWQLKEAGVENLVFIDDTFNVPLPRFKEICRMMVRNQLGFDWFSYFRCSNCDEEAFDLMAAAGCKGTFLGIESGDQTVLDSMNKYANLDKYKFGIRNLNERGITTYASFFVGFPPESEETVARTIEFIQETAPRFVNCGMWYYDDKTPIAHRETEFGLRGGGFQWQHATMDWRRANELASHVYRSVSSSTIMPTYSFDFWSIPYLRGHGFSIDQIEQFCRLTQPMLLKGLDDDLYSSESADRELRNFLANGGAPAAMRGADASGGEREVV